MQKGDIVICVNFILSIRTGRGWGFKNLKLLQTSFRYRPYPKVKKMHSEHVRRAARMGGEKILRQC